MNPKIGIIDYECGNIGSLVKAFKYINCETIILKDNEINTNFSHLVLPGVGSFKKGSEYLFNSKNLKKLIFDHHQKGNPLLGICLGYQLFSNSGEEGGFSKGLGFLDAECLHLSKLIDASRIKIPNVGFQKISSDTSNLNLISKCYYFVHSYCLNFNKIPKTYQTIVAGQEELYIGVQINNLWGFQFHPEKSQIMGLELLKKFTEI